MEKRLKNNKKGRK